MNYQDEKQRNALMFFFERHFTRVPFGCWEWDGLRFTKRGGYGSFTCRPLGVINQRAHRVSYQISHACNLLRSQHVLHRCDNPACVRPNHLFLGDQARNMEDKVSKNRQNIGQDHGRSKLSELQVLEIIRRVSSGERSRKIARDFGISEATISDIKWGRSWAHLPRL